MSVFVQYLDAVNATNKSIHGMFDFWQTYVRLLRINRVGGYHADGPRARFAESLNRKKIVHGSA